MADARAVRPYFQPKCVYAPVTIRYTIEIPHVIGNDGVGIFVAQYKSFVAI